MISSETKASGLLSQLSRARPMTAADLVVVSEVHMLLGSPAQSYGSRTVQKCLLRPFTSGVVFHSIIIIEKSPGVMMKICWIKRHFNRIIVVCNRVPISKHDLCSSLRIFVSGFQRFAGRLRNQIGTIHKVKRFWKKWYTIYFFINFT